MSKKDFDAYYNDIFRQYKELNIALEDMSKEVADGMVTPERVEGLKQTIAPIATSFKTLTYIKYLLDKPTRKSKHKRYNQCSKTKLEISKGYQKQDIMERNQEILDNLKL